MRDVSLTDLIKSCGQPKLVDRRRHLGLYEEGQKDRCLTIYHGDEGDDGPIAGRIGCSIVNVWNRFELPKSAMQFMTKGVWNITINESERELLLAIAGE